MIRCVVLLSLLAPLQSLSPYNAMGRSAARSALMMRIGSDGTRREDKFSYTNGRVMFGSKLLIDRVVAQMDASLAADYLSDPIRVLKVVWDHDKIKVVDRERGDYALTLRPLRFVTLQFQPCVRMRIWFDEEKRCLSMRSQGFSLRGLENLDASISSVTVDVSGGLAVTSDPEKGEALRLVGDVAFETSGKIPLVLRLTPERVLRAAGHAINSQILEYVREKFLGPLISAMRRWKNLSDAVEKSAFQRTS